MLPAPVRCSICRKHYDNGVDGVLHMEDFPSSWCHLKGAESNVVWFNGQNSSWRDAAFCFWPCRPHAPSADHKLNATDKIQFTSFAKDLSQEPRMKKMGGDFLSSQAPAFFLRRINTFHISLKEMWLREPPVQSLPGQANKHLPYLPVSGVSHSIYWDFWRKHLCLLALI